MSEVDRLKAELKTSQEEAEGLRVKVESLQAALRSNASLRSGTDAGSGNSRSNSLDEPVDIEAPLHFFQRGGSGGGGFGSMSSEVNGMGGLGLGLGGLGMGMDAGAGMMGMMGRRNSGDSLGSQGSSNSFARLTRNETYVWASGRPGVPVVVTGISAALPGRDHDVFSKEGIKRIINGENCILPMPKEVMEEMLSRNVVQLHKAKDGSQTKKKLTDSKDMINLCAALGAFDLTDYGVNASIAATMDRAVQISVAVRRWSCVMCHWARAPPLSLTPLSNAPLSRPSLTPLSNTA